MARENTYFISDLHLGARYIADTRAHEQRVVDFLHSIIDDAEALYLLGDILDYWYEYRTVVPRGHVRFFGALAQLADAGVRIVWLTGNHDVWLFDYLRDEIGLEVLKRHTIVKASGQRVFISHGDDVGRRSWSYRFLRGFFYNRFCQWLYAGIHPRWTYALATGWSNGNRTHRDIEQEQRGIEISARNLKQFAETYSAEHPEVDHFVMGHLHLARQNKLDERRTITFLGDWIEQDTYARLTPDGDITLHHYRE